MPRTPASGRGGKRCAPPGAALRASPAATRSKKASPLATQKELSDFFVEVERRAYKQALYAVRDDHQALDIVQDAMLKLTEKYAARPATELPLVFQRILQNTIRDFYRRQKVRAIWTTPISSLFGADSESDAISQSGYFA